MEGSFLCGMIHLVPSSGGSKAKGSLNLRSLTEGGLLVQGSFELWRSCSTHRIVLVVLDWEGGLWCPMDGGLESFNNGFLVLPNRARRNANLLVLGLK